MTIDIMGLGYVGAIMLLHLCENSDSLVAGIDVHPEKISRLKSGQLDFYEPNTEIGLSLLTQKKVDLLKALPTKRDTNHRIYVICVGTPENPDGSVDLNQVDTVLKEISTAIKMQPQIVHTIILRSTVPAGSIENRFLPFIEKEIDQTLHSKFSFYAFPEFLREGNAIEDLNNPSLFVVGSKDKLIQQKDRDFFKLFPSKSEKSFVTDYRTAEIIKYANNSFHALKIAFANEMASFACKAGANIDEMTNIFLNDTHLNISRSYLKPGFAFGGPCLTKELKAIEFIGKSSGISLPLINNILKSNESHFDRFLAILQKYGGTKIGLAGITFKPDTDDIRHSPLVKIIEQHQTYPTYREKVEFHIYDSQKALDRLRQRNLNVGIFYSTEFEDVIKNSSSVLLGPKKLSEIELDLLKTFEGPIIDLLWHPIDGAISSKVNYLSLYGDFA